MDKYKLAYKLQDRRLREHKRNMESGLPYDQEFERRKQIDECYVPLLEKLPSVSHQDFIEIHRKYFRWVYHGEIIQE